MQKRSLFIFIVGAILLTSCSASEVLRGVGLEEDDEVTPQSCPLATVPNYHSIKLSLQSKIHLRNDRAPVLWQQGIANKNKFYFSFGGILVESSKSGGLLKMIKALNAGENCLVTDYLEGATKAADLKALQSLADAGAFA
jgi:hypothetical protein